MGSRQTRRIEDSSSRNQSKHILERMIFSKQQLYGCIAIQSPRRRVALSSGSDCDAVWLLALGE